MLDLLYIPTKRRYDCDHAFFSEGDIAIRAAWFQKQDSQLSDYWDSVVDEVITTQRQSMHCDLQPCKGYGRTSFPNITAYEIHYDMWHRYICEECHKSFPGEQWLELHFDEFHDVIKTIMKERGEKIYRCYVPGCEKLFSTPKMRRLHLIDKHNYSRLYPFDLPFTGNVSFKERQRRLEHSKKMQEAKKFGLHISEKAVQGQTKKTERMEVEKPDHDGSSENLDTAMEEITQGIAKLKVPRSISFGRAPRGLHSGWGNARETGRLRQRKDKPPTSMIVDQRDDNTNNTIHQTNQVVQADGDVAEPNRRNRNRKKARERRRTPDVEMDGGGQ